jgi:hypothetical protein
VTPTPQFGASLADDSRVIIYDCNMFIVQATGVRASSRTRRHLPVVFASKFSGGAFRVVAVLFVGPVTAVVLVVALPGAEDAAAVAASEFRRFAGIKTSVRRTPFEGILF